MFHSRHFYYRFFLANIKVSSRPFSNWHNSTTIFGHQFAKIQNWSSFQHHWNIQHAIQKFCQRSQFCSETHPVDDIASNSSSPIISPKTPTNTAIEQNEQQQEIKRLNFFNPIGLKLVLRTGKSGQKSFQIRRLMGIVQVNFPNMPVPQDAYAIVRKMDELIVELATENFDQKFVTKDNDEPKSELKRQTVEMNGCLHKFQLELLFFPNMGSKKNIQKCLFFQLRASRLADNNSSLMLLPLEALPWLREHMADMLSRHDGTEAIAREAPGKIPKQFLEQ